MNESPNKMMEDFDKIVEGATELQRQRRESGLNPDDFRAEKAGQKSMEQAIRLASDIAVAGGYDLETEEGKSALMSELRTTIDLGDSDDPNTDLAGVVKRVAASLESGVTSANIKNIGLRARKS